MNRFYGTDRNIPYSSTVDQISNAYSIQPHDQETRDTRSEMQQRLQDSTGMIVPLYRSIDRFKRNAVKLAVL
jgi:hypothetical protein